MTKQQVLDLGYRPLVDGDIGKEFGVDLELDVIAIEKDFLQDYSTGDEIVTKVIILSTSGVGENIYFEFGDNYGDNAPPTLSSHVLIKKNDTVVYENTTQNKIIQDVVITMTDGEVITEVFEFLTNAYGSLWIGESWIEDDFDKIFYVKDIVIPTITFETNGGNVIDPITSNTLPELEVATKSGYNFKGWYYDIDLLEQAQQGDTLTEDITLYAKWEKLPSTDNYIYNIDGKQYKFVKDFGLKAIGDEGHLINKVIPASTGNIPKLNASGNLEDSGFKLEKSVPSNAVFTDTTYTLPQASTNTRGGIRADTKQVTDTVEVKIDVASEKLFVPTYPTMPTDYADKRPAQKTITTATTLALTDEGKVILANGALKVTIPLNSSVSFPIDTEIAIVRYGTGEVTIGTASGATLNGEASTTTFTLGDQYSSVALKKISTDAWLIFGNFT